MPKRLNVTVLDPTTSGDVSGSPALTRVRSVTAICSGIVSVVSSGNHLSVTDDGYGWGTRYVPSGAAGCDEVDSSGRPLESRSNFTGPPGVRPEAFGLTASSSDRHGRTGGGETSGGAGAGDAPTAAVRTMNGAAARCSGVDRMMLPPEETTVAARLSSTRADGATGRRAMARSRSPRARPKPSGPACAREVI